MTSRARAWLWVGAIVLVGGTLRVYGVGAEPFWLDEAHSANFTRLSLSELVSWSDPYDRGNPPGYTLLLKAWAQISRSDAWLRMLSVVAGTATLPVVYLIARRIADHRAGLVASAFLALSGYHIRFSQEARTYALIGLVTALAMLAVAQLIAQPDGDSADRIRGRRPWKVREAGLGLRRPLSWTDVAWLGYGVVAGVAFLFHATGVAVAASANFAILVWCWRTRPRPPRFLRNWVLANLVTVAIWLTWIPGFVGQVRSITEHYWVPAPTFLSVAEGFADLLAPSFRWGMPWNGQTWGAAALALAGLAIIWTGARRLSLGPKMLVWSFLGTLPIIELVYSIRRPLFLTRTLVGLLVPISIGLAIAVTRRRWWIPLTAALLAVSAFGAVAYHASYMKSAWDRAAAIVAAGAEAGDLILVQPANTVVAFDHYFERTDSPLEALAMPSDIPDRLESGPRITGSDPRQVVEMASEANEVWLILNRPPDSESLEPALTEAATSAERHTLPDLVVVHFDMP